MKYLVAIALLCGCLTMPVRAQDSGSPEALRAAQELTAIVNGDFMNQMVASMWSPLEQSLAGKVDAATLAELRAEFQRFATSLSADVMKEAPAIYARNFTAQELRDMLAFYKTPTGIKALTVLPKMMPEIMAPMMARMPALQRDLAARIEAIMQKHGYKN
jgi:hypothetical protein